MFYTVVHILGDSCAAGELPVVCHSSHSQQSKWSRYCKVSHFLLGPTELNQRKMVIFPSGDAYGLSESIKHSPSLPLSFCSRQTSVSLFHQERGPSPPVPQNMTRAPRDMAALLEKAAVQSSTCCNLTPAFVRASVDIHLCRRGQLWPANNPRPRRWGKIHFTD